MRYDTPYGIMVGSADAAVYLAFEYPKSRAGKDMVDAEIKMVLIIRESRSRSRFYKSIVQAFTYHPVGIRYGRIVEVAAHQDIAG